MINLGLSSKATLLRYYAICQHISTKISIDIKESLTCDPLSSYYHSFSRMDLSYTGSNLELVYELISGQGPCSGHWHGTYFSTFLLLLLKALFFLPTFTLHFSVFYGQITISQISRSAAYKPVDQTHWRGLESFSNSAERSLLWRCILSPSIIIY